jgi:hypothetical protein
MVQGSALIDLIKKVLEDKPYMSVEVYTLDESTISYNYIYNKEEQVLSDLGSYGQTPSISVPENKSDIAYINPMASFLGTTYKSKSGVIVCIRFEQQN